MRWQNSISLNRVQYRLALVAKGGLQRTFGGIALFVALALFAFGSYLLEQDFTHPLTADPASTLAAGFFLAISAVLLSFLLIPKHSGRTRRVRMRLRKPRQDAAAQSAAESAAFPQRTGGENFPVRERHYANDLRR